LLAQDFQSGSGGTSVSQFSPAHSHPPPASLISLLHLWLLAKINEYTSEIQNFSKAFQVLMSLLTFEGTYTFSKLGYHNYFAIQVTRPLEILQWIWQEFWVVSIPNENFMV